MINIMFILLIVNLLVTTGIIVFMFYLTKKISSIKTEKLDELESALTNVQEEIKVNREKCEDIKSLEEQIGEFHHKVENIENKSMESSEMFKRVVYGFDFIVQGCKKALEMNDIESVEKKLDSTFKEITVHTEEEIVEDEKFKEILEEETSEGVTDSINEMHSDEIKEKSKKNSETGQRKKTQRKKRK